ncbi:MAG: sigma-70 family RNA polymerase sigma factor [Kiritimatiellae bacterium]|nr:sigma-70 family RNA polymerase sigma factor [Kiritimatiellia bacterium]
MEKPEIEWLAQYRKGHVEALGKLVEHFRRPLSGFILNMTERHGDADEIFQEVWFRATQKMDSYKQKNFLSWLFRIAHNLIIDHARKKKPVMSLQDPKEARAFEETMPSLERGPDEEVHAEHLGQKIKEATGLLSLEQREVFLMRTENVSFKEIAKIQKTSINTTLARMQYALAKLRDALKIEYEELSHEA